MIMRYNVTNMMVISCTVGSLPGYAGNRQVGMNREWSGATGGNEEVAA